MSFGFLQSILFTSLLCYLKLFCGLRWLCLQVQKPFSMYVGDSLEAHQSWNGKYRHFDEIL